MLEGIIFLFGLVIGSFLNVVIDRLPRGENIVWERSRCDSCKKQLRWFELFPVFSFVLLGGKCLRCKKPLSLQYPLVELGVGLGFAYIAHHNSLSIFSLFTAVVFSLLFVFFIIDMKEQILPDEIMLALLVTTIAMAFFVTPEQRLAHFWAGVGAGVFFMFLWLITRGRGMGFGDVKLSFLLGFLLGYPGIVVSLYIAFLTGAMAGVILILGRKAKMKSRIAFGPFLILGAVCTYLFGEWFWSVWRSLYI